MMRHKRVQKYHHDASTVAAAIGETGTSLDEATLINQKIKSVALAILDLCLSEGIR